MPTSLADLIKAIQARPAPTQMPAWMIASAANDLKKFMAMPCAKGYGQKVTSVCPFPGTVKYGNYRPF